MFKLAFLKETFYFKLIAIKIKFFAKKVHYKIFVTKFDWAYFNENGRNLRYIYSFFVL